MPSHPERETLYQRAVAASPHIDSLHERTLSVPQFASLAVEHTDDGPLAGVRYVCDAKTEEEVGARELSAALNRSADANSLVAQLSPDSRRDENMQEAYGVLTADSLILSTRPIATVSDVSFTFALQEASDLFSRVDISRRRDLIRDDTNGEALDPADDGPAEAEAGGEAGGEGDAFAGAVEEDAAPAEASIEGAGVDDAGERDAEDWAKLKVADLRVMLTELGGEPKRLTKARLIEAITEIRAARAAQGQDAAPDTSGADSTAGETDTAGDDGGAPAPGGSVEAAGDQSPHEGAAELAEFIHPAWFNTGVTLVIPRGEDAFRAVVDGLHEALIAGTLLVSPDGGALRHGLTFIDSRDVGESTRERMLSETRRFAEQMAALEPVKEALAERGHSWFELGSPSEVDGEVRYVFKGRARDASERAPFGRYTIDELLAEKFVDKIDE